MSTVVPFPAGQNQFDRFWSLGYKRLVPVIPPDAKISERSTLFKRVGTRQDGRGKTPGAKGRDGCWSGFDWVPHEADERDLTRWNGMGAGVGIKTGQGLVAIDADTLNPDFAKIIRDTVEQRLGRLPVRVGNYPKALYLARVSGPFQYCRIEFGERDERGVAERVEILSDDRQFVAHGIHPKTGKPFEWPRGLEPFDGLPVFEPDEITQLLQALRTKLPAASELVKEGAATDVNQATLKGPLEAVRKAVEAIPNTSALFPSRESYRDMGYAIKAALPDDEAAAFEIFSDWCARWDEGDNDPDIVEADWRRMKPPFRRGASWLYDLAAEHGAGKFSHADVWFDEIKPPDNPFAEIELNASKEARTDTYRLITLDDLRARPPAEWLVARHIPKQSVGFLYSVPGAGKSFWILDIGLHVAAGLAEWNGDALSFPDEAQVLYLAAEGSYGFRNRLEAWLQKHPGQSENLSKRFKMIEETINFMSPEDVGKLLRTVRAAQAGGRFALVVVDTVSRAMPGADENLQKDMTLFVKACDAVRDATGGAVVGVHHAGKSGDMRGSTVLLGAGDFVFRLERKKGASVGHVLCEKQKDGPDGWDEPYRFDVVDLDGGETSLVVERADMTIGPGTELTPGVASGVFAAMRKAWDEGAPWARAAQAKERYAVRRMVADFGFEAEAAEEALRLWEGSGMICVAQASSHSRVKGYKVLAEPGQDVLSEGVFD